MAQLNRLYSGTLQRRYTVDVPADPGWARPEQHRVDDGHMTDTSGRDEAPRGGGWVPQDFLTVQPGPGGGSPATFAESHDRIGDHRQNDGGGLQEAYTARGWLRYLRGYFPEVPNTPETLENAGASGAAHGGIGSRGMEASNAIGRKTVDGRYVQNPNLLGHTYRHPIERVKRALHMNRPKLRRVLAPSITRERGSVSPGGYSSQYNPAASAWSAGPSEPNHRRLIKSFGQVEYNDVSQDPANARRGNPGPIGNGGW